MHPTPKSAALQTRPRFRTVAKRVGAAILAAVLAFPLALSAAAPAHAAQQFTVTGSGTYEDPFIYHFPDTPWTCDASFDMTPRRPDGTFTLSVTLQTGNPAYTYVSVLPFSQIWDDYGSPFPSSRTYTADFSFYEQVVISLYDFGSGCGDRDILFPSPPAYASPTSVSISGDDDLEYGAAAAFTAAVSAADSATPTGLVNYTVLKTRDASTVLSGSATLLNGATSISVPASKLAEAGDYRLTVSYPGASGFAGSTQQAPFTVREPLPSGLSVSSFPDTIALGETVTFEFAGSAIPGELQLILHKEGGTSETITKHVGSLSSSTLSFTPDVEGIVDFDLRFVPDSPSYSTDTLLNQQITVEALRYTGGFTSDLSSPFLTTDNPALALYVHDQLGYPAANKSVEVVLESPDGNVHLEPVTTDSHGRATVQLGIINAAEYAVKFDVAEQGAAFTDTPQTITVEKRSLVLVVDEYEINDAGTTVSYSGHVESSNPSFDPQWRSVIGQISATLDEDFDGAEEVELGADGYFAGTLEAGSVGHQGAGDHTLDFHMATNRIIAMDDVHEDITISLVPKVVNSTWSSSPYEYPTVPQLTARFTDQFGHDITQDTGQFALVRDGHALASFEYDSDTLSDNKWTLIIENPHGNSNVAEYAITYNGSVLQVIDAPETNPAVMNIVLNETTVVGDSFVVSGYLQDWFSINRAGFEVIYQDNHHQSGSSSPDLRTTTDADGAFSFTVPFQALQHENAVVAFEETQFHAAGSVNVEDLPIAAQTYSLSVVGYPQRALPGESITFEAHVVDQFGTPVPDLGFTVGLGTQTHDIETDSDGNVSIETSFPTAGERAVAWKFANAPTWVTASKGIEVAHHATTLSVDEPEFDMQDGEPYAVFEGIVAYELPVGNTSPSPTGAVTVLFDNTAYQADVSPDGRFDVRVPFNRPGVYNVDIAYGGDNVYSGSDTSTLFTVEYGFEYELTVDEPLVYGQPSTITLEVTNKYGFSFDGTVRIFQDGLFHSPELEIVDGVATFTEFIPKRSPSTSIQAALYASDFLGQALPEDALVVHFDGDSYDVGQADSAVTVDLTAPTTTQAIDGSRDYTVTVNRDSSDIVSRAGGTLTVYQLTEEVDLDHLTTPPSGLIVGSVALGEDTIETQTVSVTPYRNNGDVLLFWFNDSNERFKSSGYQFVLDPRSYYGTVDVDKTNVEWGQPVTGTVTMTDSIDDNAPVSGWVEVLRDGYPFAEPLPLVDSAVSFTDDSRLDPRDSAYIYSVRYYSPLDPDANVPPGQAVQLEQVPDDAKYETPAIITTASVTVTKSPISLAGDATVRQSDDAVDISFSGSTTVHGPQFDADVQWDLFSNGQRVSNGILPLETSTTGGLKGMKKIAADIGYYTGTYQGTLSLTDLAAGDYELVATTTVTSDYFTAPVDETRITFTLAQEPIDPVAPESPSEPEDTPETPQPTPQPGQSQSGNDAAPTTSEPTPTDSDLADSGTHLMPIGALTTLLLLLGASLLHHRTRASRATR